MFGGDGEVRCGNELEASPRHDAVDSADDGLPAMEDHVEESPIDLAPLPPVTRLLSIGLRVLVHVAAGAESLVPASGQHDELHVVIPHRIFERRNHFPQRAEKIGVVLVRPVDRDHGRMFVPVLLVENVAIRRPPRRPLRGLPHPSLPPLSPRSSRHLPAGRWPAIRCMARVTRRPRRETDRVGRTSLPEADAGISIAPSESSMGHEPVLLKPPGGAWSWTLLLSSPTHATSHAGTLTSGPRPSWGPQARKTSSMVRSASATGAFPLKSSCEGPDI